MSFSVVAKHYDRLAHQYDRRWRAYITQTLERALDALKLSGTERILDVGCGTGEFARMAIGCFPDVSIVGVDAAAGMIAVARRKLSGMSHVSVHVADAERLPFVQEAFDVVVCANTLHHVRDPRQVLQECVRVLRPGGRVVVVDWCRDFWHCRLLHEWLRLVDRTYVTMYRLADIHGMMEPLGLVMTGARRFMAKPCYGMMWCVAEKARGSPAPAPGLRGGPGRLEA